MYQNYAGTGTIQAVLSRLQEDLDSHLFLGALPLHGHCQGCRKLDAASTIANIMQPLLAEIASSRILFSLMHFHENHKVPLEFREGQDHGRCVGVQPGNAPVLPITNCACF